jgi:2-polyprenyl-3-methyl-5-hydroxy-6-metoxy-1,4-benzoquinol methylase
MQQAPNDSLKVLGDVALPLLLLAGGLLARVLSDGKLQNSEPKVSVLTNGTTFADVPNHEGLLEAKEELEIVVDFLKNPEPFIKLGAQIPRKVLLSGPGDKKLMAKALAGESGVPFLEVVSNAKESPVSEVFADAKGKAPCILFVPLDKPCVDATCDLPDKTVPLPTWSGERLDEVLNGMDDFKTSGIIFVASASKQEEVVTLSSRFDMGVSVGYESDLVVGRRFLKANRLEEAVEAFMDACKGGKWRCGCSFCLAFSATDEMRAELSNAQELLEDHWEKYHDMRVALPSVVFPERALRVRQSVACSACSLSGDQGPGGAVWAAGAALASYISKNAPPGHEGEEKMAPWRGLKVLELGSGTGIAGIAAAAEGADVLLTDKDFLVPLMANNIRLNQDQMELGSADCEAFNWTSEPPKEVSGTTWDVVLGADLVESPADVPLFADTLASLLGPGGAAAGATAIYAHDPQSQELDVHLKSALKTRGLSCMDLPSLPSQATGEVVPYRVPLSRGPGDGAVLDRVVFWLLQSSSAHPQRHHTSAAVLG